MKTHEDTGKRIVMKARVKATGEIIEVAECASRYKERGWNFVSIATRVLYTYADLDFDVNNEYPDYWEKLKHQYAGMAMQAYITRHDDDRFYIDDLANDAVNFATALVEKLKEEK